jgi:hypothetical protein
MAESLRPVPAVVVSALVCWWCWSNFKSCVLRDAKSRSVHAWFFISSRTAAGFPSGPRRRRARSPRYSFQPSAHAFVVLSHDAARGPNRTNMSLFTSDDGGTSFDRGRVPWAVCPAGYSAVTSLGDRQLGRLYERASTAMLTRGPLVLMYWRRSTYKKERI